MMWHYNEEHVIIISEYCIIVSEYDIQIEDVAVWSQGIGL